MHQYKSRRIEETETTTGKNCSTDNEKKFMEITIPWRMITIDLFLIGTFLFFEDCLFNYFHCK